MEPAALAMEPPALQLEEMQARQAA